MSTSDYKSDALKAKEKLETVSPSMCLAKWNQTSLHLPTGLTNSCYHPPLHKMDAEAVKKNPAALHNTARETESTTTDASRRTARGLLILLEHGEDWGDVRQALQIR